MKSTSLIISVGVHAVALAVMLFVVKTVPELRLPDAIYSVKILQPIVGSPAAKSDDGAKADAKVAEPAKPKPKPKEETIPVPKKPERKADEKAKPAEKASVESQPLSATVGGGAPDGTSLSVEGARFPFSYYLAAVERKVSENWYSAVSEGGAGLTCIVYFKLFRDGRAEAVTVEQTSGNSYFDQSAVRAVRSAVPFPPLPRAFTDAFLAIHFTFTQRED